MQLSRRKRLGLSRGDDWYSAECGFNCVLRVAVSNRGPTILWLLLGSVFMWACAPSYSVVLDELNDPRGMSLRADGTLCVAEAGRLEEGDVIRPGPSNNRALTGSLTCLDAGGNRQRVAQRLPFVRYNADGMTFGPTDVAEINDQLYLLTGEGIGAFSRSVLRIDGADSGPIVIADFLAYAERTATPDYFDEINIITNPYAMLPDAQNERFLVTDGARGEVYAVGLDGEIERYSAMPGFEVPTGITWGPDGFPYVASFSELPHERGAGAIVRLGPEGEVSIALGELTTPIDLAFDSAGRLYVLEFVSTVGAGHPYRDRTGRLLRFDRLEEGWGSSLLILEGLPNPTSVLVGSEGTVYVTVHGAYSDPMEGQVLAIDASELESGAALPLSYKDP